ncbi:MAG: HAD family hydrolase [Hyphomicrobiaceae bacterium]|nr:HAD family hydrolase [Hyphomicrobiaceae bacterium]
MATVLVFDLDDTLYPERDFALSGFRAIERWASAELGLAPGIAAEMTRLLDDGHLGTLFPIALKAAHPAHTPEELARAIEIYREHAPEIALFDDARWALAHYAGRGPLGLITDGTHGMQRRKVEALGIAPHFREMVFTGALGGRAFHKPHPAAYEQIEAALAGPRARFVYVGDNPSKDFVTPNARGWVSVMVHRPEHARIHAKAEAVDGGAPQHTIASLHELPAILGG